jgi:hypothetical protein
MHCPLTGRPWIPWFTGTGHVWPLLNGERGEQDLQTRDPAGASQMLLDMTAHAQPVPTVIRELRTSDGSFSANAAADAGQLGPERGGNAGRRDRARATAAERRVGRISRGSPPGGLGVFQWAFGPASGEVLLCGRRTEGEAGPLRATSCRPARGLGGIT